MLFLITFNCNFLIALLAYSIISFCTSFFPSCLYFDSRSSGFEILIFSFYFWTVCVFLNFLSSLENRFLLSFSRERKSVQLLYQNCIIYMNIAFCIRFSMGMAISSQIFKPLHFTLFTDLDQTHPWLLKRKIVILADLLSCNSLVPKEEERTAITANPLQLFIEV